MSGPQKTKAAGLDTRAALENTQLDYAPMGLLVQANINGQRTASRFLGELQSHYADPDTLYLAIKAILPESQDMAMLANLRGFARTIQKRLERGVA